MVCSFWVLWGTGKACLSQGPAGLLFCSGPPPLHVYHHFWRKIFSAPPSSHPWRSCYSTWALCLPWSHSLIIASLPLSLPTIYPSSLCLSLSSSSTPHPLWILPLTHCFHLRRGPWRALASAGCPASPRPVWSTVWSPRSATKTDSLSGSLAPGVPSGSWISKALVPSMGTGGEYFIVPTCPACLPSAQSPTPMTICLSGLVTCESILLSLPWKWVPCPL